LGECATGVDCACGVIVLVSSSSFVLPTTLPNWPTPATGCPNVWWAESIVALRYYGSATCLLDCFGNTRVVRKSSGRGGSLEHESYEKEPKPSSSSVHGVGYLSKLLLLCLGCLNATKETDTDPASRRRLRATVQAPSIARQGRHYN
jgi:hypothetical protein